MAVNGSKWVFLALQPLEGLEGIQSLFFEEDLEMGDTCIFCKIANGEIPSKTIYEDDLFRVILDINPASKGHVLILTKKHYENIYELGKEEAASVFALAKKLAEHMKNLLPCDGMNILQNNGEEAGQTMFHFHLHLIPRYQSDDVGLYFKSHTGDLGYDLEDVQKLIMGGVY